MNNIDDFKVEFRATPWGGGYHVLEYRVSPDQDLTYLKEVSLMFGLIKFKIKRKYPTEWVRPLVFTNMITSYRYERDHLINWLPISHKT